MIKKEFIGRVNDKTFTSVEDYNAEVTRLMESGESFTASTETSMVDVPEVDEKDAEPEEESQPIEVPPTDEYCEDPGDPESTEVLENTLSNTLNQFTGADTDIDILNNFTRALEQNIKSVMKIINNYSIDDLIKFLLSAKGEKDVICDMWERNNKALSHAENETRAYNNVISEAEEDIADLRKELAEYENYVAAQKNNLADAEKRRRILTHGSALLDTVLDSYNKATNRASERIKELDNY